MRSICKLVCRRAVEKIPTASFGNALSSSIAAAAAAAKPFPVVCLSVCLCTLSQFSYCMYFVLLTFPLILFNGNFTMPSFFLLVVGTHQSCWQRSEILSDFLCCCCCCRHRFVIVALVDLTDADRNTERHIFKIGQFNYSQNFINSIYFFSTPFSAFLTPFF